MKTLLSSGEVPVSDKDDSKSNMSILQRCIPREMKRGNPAESSNKVSPQAAIISERRARCMNKVSARVFQPTRL